MKTSQHLVPRQLKMKYRQGSKNSLSPFASPSPPPHQRFSACCLDMVSPPLQPLPARLSWYAPSVNAFCPYKERAQADRTM